MPPAVPVRWLWRIRSLVGLLAWVTVAHAAFEVGGGGARTTALGGAFGAGTDAAEGIWNNPAGNARSSRLQLSTTHVLLYPGIEKSPSLNSLALVAPLAGGNLGFGLSALGAQDWDEQIGTLGYGRALHPRLGLGVNLRTGGWQTGGLSHRVWGLDVGAIYEVGWISSRHYLRLGWVGRDLLRTSQAAGGQDAARAPRALVFGAGLSSGEDQLLVDVERRAGRTQLRAGFESALPGTGGMRMRLGGSAFTADWHGGDLSAGLGYRWRAWSFDLSYTYPLGPGGAFGGIHRLSLGYRRP